MYPFFSETDVQVFVYLTDIAKAFTIEKGIEMRRKLLSVGAGKNQTPFIRKARDMGYEIIGVDRNPEAEGFKYCRFKIICNTHKPHEVRSKLKNRVNIADIAGIISRGADMSLMTANLLANECGSPLFSPDYVHLAIDKNQLKQFCAAHNIPTLKGGIVNKQSPWVGKSIIVKPNQPKTGKVNVRRVQNEAEWFGAIEKAEKGSYDAKALSEAYLSGMDIAVLAVVNNKSILEMVIFDELIEMKQNRFSGLGYQWPSVSREYPLFDKIKGATKQFLQKWKTGRNIALLSFKANENGNIGLYEVNYGLGGDLLLEKFLPSLFRNVDMVEFYLNLILGLPVGKLKLSDRGIKLYKGEMFSACSLSIQGHN
jgi:biotin carboxylase